MLLGTLPGLPTASLPCGHCLTPAPVKSTRQSLGSAHTRSELNNEGQNTPSISEPQLCFQCELLSHALIYQDLSGGDAGPPYSAQFPVPSPLVSVSISNSNCRRVLLALQPHLTHKLGESCRGLWM